MNRELHVVSVCRTLPNPEDPSAGIFVLQRLAAMADQVQLRVLQPVPYFPLARPMPQWSRARGRELKGLDITHTPMFYLPGMMKSADAAWLARSISAQIARWHQQQPIDLLDAHFAYPEGAGCLSAARRLGIPLFITIRGFENEYVHRPGIAGQMLGAMRAALGCISVSHSLAELARGHGVADERIRVIHNAIDGALFKWGEPSRARAQLGIDSDRRLVVSVGHLVSRKRHHVLIRAFAELKRRHPGALLVIIGARSFEARYPDELSVLARELGVAADVRFAGNIPPHDVVAWLQAADVFALGTAREGCCNAVIEALAAGVPTVTTPVGDNRHFVREDVNGYLVGVDDSAALAAGLERVLHRSWDRAGIAARLAAQAGSWRDVGGRVVDFMRERLSSVPSTRFSYSHS